MSSIAIITEADARAPIADAWLDASSGGSEPVVAPPAALKDVCGADVVVLDVAAAGLPGALFDIKSLIGPQTIVVSLSVEVPLDEMRSVLGEGPALFRAVVPYATRPGEGAAAIAGQAGTEAAVVERVKEAFAWVGHVEMVGEEALAAVAALTLGGAAFMYEALQGLQEEAEREGLPPETARAFVNQTVLATALLLREHAGSPADLKDQVASPGGTTIAALAALEDGGARGAFIRAVQRTALAVHARQNAAQPRDPTVS